MKDIIRIVSDGTPYGTHVYDAVGIEIFATRIEILPLVPDRLVEARITVFASLDLKATMVPVEAPHPYPWWRSPLPLRERVARWFRQWID